MVFEERRIRYLTSDAVRQSGFVTGGHRLSVWLTYSLILLLLRPTTGDCLHVFTLDNFDQAAGSDKSK